MRPDDRQRLIELMEGVEDIPGTALHEGLSWAWESFPEYLDDLEAKPRDLDLGAQVPHGALRLHVMGERGAAREPATPSDIAAMAELAKDAVAAGALGFTTSRTMNHRSSRGELTPSLNAEADELIGIAEALGSIGQGVVQVVSDFLDLDGEFDMLRTVAERSGRPMSISIAQSPLKPDQWRTLLDRMSEATAQGVTMRGQVGARAVGLLLGFEATLNPFMMAPAWADAEGPPAGRARRPAAPRRRPPGAAGDAAGRQVEPGARVPADHEVRADVPARRPARLRAVTRTRRSPPSPSARAATRPRSPTTSCSATAGGG